MQLEKFIIARTASLREALSQIELNHPGIILSVDADRRLISSSRKPVTAEAELK